MRDCPASLGHGPSPRRPPLRRQPPQACVTAPTRTHQPGPAAGPGSPGPMICPIIMAGPHDRRRAGPGLSLGPGPGRLSLRPSPRLGLGAAATQPRIPGPTATAAGAAHWLLNTGRSRVLAPAADRPRPQPETRACGSVGTGSAGDACGSTFPRFPPVISVC